MLRKGLALKNCTEKGYCELLRKTCCLLRNHIQKKISSLSKSHTTLVYIEPKIPSPALFRFDGSKEDTDIEKV